MSLYNHRWRKERKHYLALNPLCCYCLKQGKVTPATVVDHITPHKGDLNLFWDANNWQPMCKHCHDSVKQSEERGRTRTAYGVDGLPIDPKAHW
jgi:5-methylcytosine-specific restriction endonuclease McrA